MLIGTNFRVDESVQRLRDMLAATTDSTDELLRLVGIVSESRIEIMRKDDFAHSIFRPQFVGSLESRKAGTIVRGKFRFSRAARSIIAAWWISLFAWVALSVAIAIRTDAPELWYLPLAGLVLTVLGVGFLAFARHYYRPDADRIVLLICAALHGAVIEATTDSSKTE
jgi:hypothetical protein